MTMTLYKIIMACDDYYIDENPMDLKGHGDWVAVQTYKKINHLDGSCHFEPGVVMSFRRTATLAFTTLRDCEVVM